MRLAVATILFFGLLSSSAFAQELVPDTEVIVRARVIEIVAQETLPIVGTDVTALNQTIRAEILEGVKDGEEVVVENDYIRLREGETFYMRYRTDIDGTEYFSVADPYRLPFLLGLIALFVLVVAIFGGTQGLRGLASLVGGLFLIVYLLLPGILAGYSPVFVAIGVASLIIGVGSFVTHGFNRTTLAAVFGMIATILFTGALAWASIYFGRLTGFETEEAVYLHFNTGGTIDFAGLLLGGVLIGLLGVLYDIAIGQAVSVEEIKRAGQDLHAGEVYARAIRIGREHTGALVNSLAIAYVGVSLPLLLLFYNSGAGNFLLNMNKEIFATEIVRTMVGSIGLVLAVPITTLISVWLLTGRSEHGKNGHSHIH
jgi:uncharacterized membrane protein